MIEGIELLKYPMGGGSPALKYLQLSNDENELQWREGKKASKYSSLPIREVDDVVIGWETEVVILLFKDNSAPLHLSQTPLNPTPYLVGLQEQLTR